jgi:hypothetical protein
MKAVDFSTGSIFLLPSSSLDVMADSATVLRRYDMNGRFQMQGGKNRILPK